MSFDISKAMTIKLSSNLPPEPVFDPQHRRAPNRGYDLTPSETVVAVKNALRYVPESLHETLAPEFLNELITRGRIYGYRYRPTGAIKAKPIDTYKGILEARAMQLMIDNNLDFDVALYPYELVLATILFRDLECKLTCVFVAFFTIRIENQGRE